MVMMGVDCIVLVRHDGRQASGGYARAVAAG